jgi:hypothetical protein
MSLSVIGAWAFLQPFLRKLKRFIERNILSNDYEILSYNDLYNGCNEEISRFLFFFWSRILVEFLIPIVIGYISPVIYDFIYEVIQTYFSTPPPPTPPLSPVFLDGDDLSHGDDKIKEKSSEPRFIPGLKNDEPEIQEQINFDPVQIMQANQNLNPVQINPIPDPRIESLIHETLSVIAIATATSLLVVTIIVAEASIKSICMC